MKTLRRLLLLGVVLLDAGCGLPDTYYLQPPSPGTLAPGPGYFQFSNPIHDANHDINVTFLGNELFYKFYSSSAVDTNAYDPNNPSDASVQLLAKGFSPVCLSTDQSPNRSVPLIAMGTSITMGTNYDGSSCSVVVNILPTNGDSSTTNYVLNYDPAVPAHAEPPVEIRRKAVQDNSPTLYKTFQDNSTLVLVPPNYSINDADIGLALYNLMDTSGEIYIALYAISYGEIIGNRTPVRSSAVYLGYLNFTFIP